MILNFKVRDFATYVALEANGQGELRFHNFHHRQTFHHLIFFIKTFQVKMEFWHLRLSIESQTTQA